MSRIDDVIQAKTQKRQQLAEKGVVIHPYSYDKQNSIAEARESEGKRVKTAGRIMSWRTHGKVVFLDLRDDTDSIQAMIRQDDVSDDQFELTAYIDSGDFLGVEGEVVVTKTGEITIQADTFTFLGKSLRPIPSKWNAAENKEARFRKRYLDILISDDTKKVLDARWLIVKEIRRYLEDNFGFTEVETPVFQPLYGGTNATPFVTHMNALDSDFYLRIAPELYLKRLVVGGYEKIYEIARNFRNEGIDQTHQPEFSMIEWYEAYADYNRMMDVAEGLVKHLIEKLHGEQKIKVGDKEIDVSGAWPRIKMTDAINQHLNLDFEAMSDKDIQSYMTENKIELIGDYTKGKAMFAIFDKLVPPFLIEPTWIVDYPRDVSPLSKAHRENPKLAERYEAYIGGKELADGWSEIVDPIDQRTIFENEQARMRDGDSEAHPLDEDFIEAMEYGMPPLGGIGMGIDRLVMFLTNTWSIKEVIAFPTLRPLNPINITGQQLDSSQIKGIDNAVRNKFPGIFFAQVEISDVNINKTDPELEKLKQQVLDSKAGLTTEDISNLNSVKEYRSLFKATGTDWHKRRPSPEALLRRIATDKGLYNVNTAVDAYNLAVVETGIGLGGFDADKLSLPIVMRFSKAGEQMLLLGDKDKTATRDGQLIYSDQDKPVTIDLNYRDINETKLTEKTTNIMLYADGAPGLTHGEVVAALEKGAKYIQQFCGGQIGEIEIIE